MACETPGRGATSILVVACPGQLQQQAGGNYGNPRARPLALSLARCACVHVRARVNGTWRTAPWGYPARPPLHNGTWQAQ